MRYILIQSFVFSSLWAFNQGNTNQNTTPTGPVNTATSRKYVRVLFMLLPSRGIAPTNPRAERP